MLATAWYWDTWVVSTIFYWKKVNKHTFHFLKKITVLLNGFGNTLSFLVKGASIRLKQWNQLLSSVLVPVLWHSGHRDRLNSLQKISHKSFSLEKSDVLVEAQTWITMSENSIFSSSRLGLDNTFGYHVALVSEVLLSSVENSKVIFNICRVTSMLRL